MPPSEVAAEMQQENIVAKTTITRTTRTVSDSTAVKPKLKADRKVAENKRRAEAKLKADRKVAEDKRKAEAKLKADRKVAEDKRTAEADRKAEKKPQPKPTVLNNPRPEYAQPNPEKKPVNWPLIIVPLGILIIIALCCCLPFWGMLFGFRFNAPVPTQPAAPVTDATSMPTATPPATEPAPVATLPPTAEAIPPAAPETTIVDPAWPTGLFKSPVPQTAIFHDESAWIIGEPGVICTPECPWTILATKDTWYGNASEGGFLYISAGQIVINADGAAFNLPYQEGNNYLVMVRGRIDDAKINTDRNLSVAMSGFVPGHAIFSTMPNGAYVSMDWIRDQLRSSMNVENATSSKTNCGALGCTQTTMLLFDVDSHYFQIWKILATDLSNWTLIEAGTK